MEADELKHENGYKRGANTSSIDSFPIQNVSAAMSIVLACVVVYSDPVKNVEPSDSHVSSRILFNLGK